MKPISNCLRTDSGCVYNKVLKSLKTIVVLEQKCGNTERRNESSEGILLTCSALKSRFIELPPFTLLADIYGGHLMSYTHFIRYYISTTWSFCVNKYLPMLNFIMFNLILFVTTMVAYLKIGSYKCTYLHHILWMPCLLIIQNQLQNAFVLRFLPFGINLEDTMT